MPEYHVAPLENLVDKFESLQGIGHKSAQRAAYQVLNMPIEEAESFAKAILDAHKRIKYCKIAATSLMMRFAEYVKIKDVTGHYLRC